MHKIKIAIIGVGYIGKVHLEAYEKMDNVDIVAGVASGSLQINERKTFKFPVFENIDELFEKVKPDVVDICLPTTLHASNAIKALKNGCHVIVEKPISSDVLEIEKMEKAEKESGKRLFVAHVCRFMPEFVIAKNIIGSRTMGRPLFYYSYRNSATPKWSESNWLADKTKSGGTVMDLQIHDIDVANWFFGNAKDYNIFEASNVKIPGAFRHVISNIAYENGVLVTLESGHLMPKDYPFSTGFRLVFEDGVLEFSGKNGVIDFKMYTDEGITDLSEQYNVLDNENGPYFSELKHFIECIETGSTSVISTNEAKEAVKSVLSLTALQKL